MARKIDMGNDSVKPTPKPIFLITSNEGTAEEVAIQHIYAPTTAAQQGTLAGLTGDLEPPIGSTTNDSITGALLVYNGTAWA